MRGQALVEMAIALPVLLVLALGVVAAGRTIYTWVALEAAAREGARAVATAPDPCDASIAVARAREVARGYDPRRLSQVEVQVGGGCGRGELRWVSVSYTVPVRDLTFLRLPGDVTITRSATHVVEQYRSR